MKTVTKFKYIYYNMSIYVCVIFFYHQISFASVNFAIALHQYKPN